MKGLLSEMLWLEVHQAPTALYLTESLTCTTRLAKQVGVIWHVNLIKLLLHTLWGTQRLYFLFAVYQRWRLHTPTFVSARAK